MEWIVEAETLSDLIDHGRYSVSSQPLIRCKDCQHWGIHKRLDIPWCREMHIDRGAEDFCSYGERRTDG